MVVIGINASHCATACVLINGKITACISEERLSRIKNQSGLPILATKEALRISKVSPSEVDLLVLSFKDPKVNGGFAAFPEIRKGNASYRTDTSSISLGSIAWRMKEEAMVRIPQSRHLYDTLVPMGYKLLVDSAYEKKVLNRIEQELGIPKEKVTTAGHHDAHGYSALFSAPLSSTKSVLVLTLDAMGDGVCSTVSVSSNGTTKRIATTPVGNSIGDLYAFTTAYLGMKMGEHEYKVMGLAPYANEKYVEPLYQKLKELIWVNQDLTFGTKIHSHMFYKFLPELFAYHRFDNIAGAVQKLTEELLLEWVRRAITKTGIGDIVCGGGVFMNVKANQKIAELPEVSSIFVMPSCGDESTAIGAAYYGYQRQKKNTSPQIFSLNDLYLGSEFSEKEIEKELMQKKYKKFHKERKGSIESTVAHLLADGVVVARFSGRMEWGARSLGNRSILAHPSYLSAVREINEQIKSRDFWMPFAPAILKERQYKYIENKKKIDAPYMIITFNSTPLGRDKFRAAMHPYDFTLRPQVVDKNWNPSFWKLLQEFEHLTGIGGVLNTSFNLHGEPVVCTPTDALEVFERSGLKHLALGPFLVSKESAKE